MYIEMQLHTRRYMAFITKCTVTTASLKGKDKCANYFFWFNTSGTFFHKVVRTNCMYFFKGQAHSRFRFCLTISLPYHRAVREWLYIYFQLGEEFAPLNHSTPSMPTRPIPRILELEYSVSVFF